MMSNSLYPLEVIIPLRRKKVPFPVVTLFARRDYIYFFRPPPSGERNDMIHCKFIGTDFYSTVITFAA
jgi:hypothetical protein